MSAIQLRVLGCVSNPIPPATWFSEDFFNEKKYYPSSQIHELSFSAWLVNLTCLVFRIAYPYLLPRRAVHVLFPCINSLLRTVPC